MCLLYTVIIRNFQNVKAPITSMPINREARTLTFLGHILTINDLRPNTDRVARVYNFSASTNITEAFLRILNQIGKLIQNLTDMTTRHGIEWVIKMLLCGRANQKKGPQPHKNSLLFSTSIFIVQPNKLERSYYYHGTSQRWIHIM